MLTELFRRHAKIETAQEQLSGVTGRRHSLASSLASAAQQLTVLQTEIARLESEDATLSAEQAKLEAWLSANAPSDGVSLDDQVLGVVESLVPADAAPDVERRQVAVDLTRSNLNSCVQGGQTMAWG